MGGGWVPGMSRLVSGWAGGRTDGPQKWAGESYFLWLSVSVIPWADTLK